MRYLPTVLGAVVLGLFLSKGILADWNPEFSFWRACLDKKQEELLSLGKEHESAVIFAGGSTCAFSIDPPTLAEVADIPAYNLGGAVPMGARYLTSMAMEAARPKDILVLALEPVFLTSDEGKETKPLGISLAVSDEKRGSSPIPLTWRDVLLKRRPGAQFMATFLGKKIMGLPGYRYSMEDFGEGGRLTTAFRGEKKSFAGPLAPQKLSEEGILLLRELLERAEKKGVRLLYTMPWTLTHPEAVTSNRANNKQLLAQISEFVPVVDDPFLGVHTEVSFFADTLNHLTDEGAKARSEAISPSLKKLINSP